MDNLNNILEKFDSRRTAMINNKKWNENAVAECFEPCAKEILLNGYFLINNEYIIDLGSIELYYHEETGPIKDYIMYHRKERVTSRIKEFNNGNLPYFEFGSMNLHQSGVDVTFENGEKEKEYRASFLIRSYRVLRKSDDIANDIIPFDPHSTHIFDDMFYKGISFNEEKKTTIEWIEREKGVYDIIDKIPRQNVAKYTENMEKVKIANGETMQSKEILRINGINYRRDMRPWQFKRLNIKEK